MGPSSTGLSHQLQTASRWETARKRLSAWAPWALLAPLAAYLASETARERFWAVPIPVLAAAIAGAGLAASWLGSGMRPPNLRSRAAAFPLGWVAGALLVALVVLVVAGARLSRSATGATRHLADVLAHEEQALVALRAFGGPAWIVVVVATAAAAVGFLVGVRRRRRPSSIETVAVVAVTMTVLSDLVLSHSVALRDLRLYLVAGTAFNHDLPVYLTTVVTAAPHDPTLLPFLYPPLTLPLFGAMASMPFPIAAGLWVSASVLAAIASLRLFGIAWRWIPLFLLWIPFAEGLYVGNAAVPALLLFAAGSRLGGSLLLGGLIKVQSAVPALWLVRERRWRALAAGLAVAGGLIVATFPIVGVSRWQEWLAGLELYQRSQEIVRTLYGSALPGLIPYPAYLVLAAGAILLALLVRGRASLARFGIATVVASPSLYSHGFLVALPALLELSPFVFWVAIAVTSVALGNGWWVVVGIAIAAGFVPALARQPRSVTLVPAPFQAIDDVPETTFADPLTLSSADR